MIDGNELLKLLDMTLKLSERLRDYGFRLQLEKHHES
jgi:hypothetical protein